VLDPDVVLRADGGAEAPSASRVVRGARAVAGQALTFSRIVESAQLVLVNGVPGDLLHRSLTPRQSHRTIFGSEVPDQSGHPVAAAIT